MHVHPNITDRTNLLFCYSNTPLSALHKQVEHSSSQKLKAHRILMFCRTDFYLLTDLICKALQKVVGRRVSCSLFYRANPVHFYLQIPQLSAQSLASSQGGSFILKSFPFHSPLLTTFSSSSNSHTCLLTSPPSVCKCRLPEDAWSWPLLWKPNAVSLHFRPVRVCILALLVTLLPLDILVNLSEFYF